MVGSLGQQVDQSGRQGLGEVLPVDGIPVLHKPVVLRVGGGQPGRACAFPAVDNRQDRGSVVVRQVVGVKEGWPVGCRVPVPNFRLVNVRWPVGAGVGSRVQTVVVRVGRQGDHHPFQFPNPEVDLDGEEGTEFARGLIGLSGERQQCHEALQQVPNLGLGPRAKTRERPAEVPHNFVHRARASVQNSEQGCQELVRAQPSAQFRPPVAADVLRCLAAEPGLIQAAYQQDRILHAFVVGDLGNCFLRGEAVRKLVAAQGGEVGGGILSILRHHRVRVELFVEQFPGVVDDGFGVVPVSQGRGGSDAAEGALGYGQAVLQPADEAGEVRTLGSVEGVEFVHHQKAQRPGRLCSQRPLRSGRTRRLSSIL